jgi:hypothetical protein
VSFSPNKLAKNLVYQSKNDTKLDLGLYYNSNLPFGVIYIADRGNANNLYAIKI